MRRSREAGGPGFLDRGHRRACRSAVTLETLLGHVQQEGLRGGDPPLDAVLADRHHLPEHSLIGRLVATAPRAPARVAALALPEAARCRRPAVADRFSSSRHRSFAGSSRPAQRSGIARAALDLGDLLSAVSRWPPRRRASAACTAHGSSSSCSVHRAGRISSRIAGDDAEDQQRRVGVVGILLGAELDRPILLLAVLRRPDTARAWRSSSGPLAAPVGCRRSPPDRSAAAAPLPRVTSRGTPPWVTVSVRSMTMSKAEAAGGFAFFGRPFGLPLWPLRKRLSTGGLPGPTARLNARHPRRDAARARSSPTSARSRHRHRPDRYRGRGTAARCAPPRSAWCRSRGRCRAPAHRAG